MISYSLYQVIVKQAKSLPASGIGTQKSRTFRATGPNWKCKATDPCKRNILGNCNTRNCIGIRYNNSYTEPNANSHH